jgi:hypothetical protein
MAAQAQSGLHLFALAALVVAACSVRSICPYLCSTANALGEAHDRIRALEKEVGDNAARHRKEVSRLSDQATAAIKEHQTELPRLRRFRDRVIRRFPEAEALLLEESGTPALKIS